MALVTCSCIFQIKHSLTSFLRKRIRIFVFIFHEDLFILWVTCSPPSFVAPLNRRQTPPIRIGETCAYIWPFIPSCTSYRTFYAKSPAILHRHRRRRRMLIKANPQHGLILSHIPSPGPSTCLCFFLLALDTQLDCSLSLWKNNSVMSL